MVWLIVDGVLLISGVLYFFLIVLFYLLQKNASRHAARQAFAESPPRVSIIISVRNEASRIRNCLSSLEKLSYPKQKFEIIFVDDGSTDDTAEIISRYTSKKQNWRILRFSKPENSTGPMPAIMHGIRHSRYEFILRTDADCRVGENWIQSIVSRFDERTAMVIGFCNLKVGAGLVQAFLSFDNLVSGVLNSSFARMGYPIACSGGNMAFRKSAVNNLITSGSFLDPAPGEDTRLAQLFHHSKVGKVKYCLCSNSVVDTDSMRNGKPIFDRMVRIHSQTFTMNFEQVLLRLVFLLGYFSPFYFLAKGAATAILSVIILRYFIEFLFLQSDAVVLNRRYNVLPDLVYQMLYPFYLIFFAFLGALFPVKWK